MVLPPNVVIFMSNLRMFLMDLLEFKLIHGISPRGVFIFVVEVRRLNYLSIKLLSVLSLCGIEGSMVNFVGGAFSPQTLALAQ